MNDAFVARHARRGSAWASRSAARSTQQAISPIPSCRCLLAAHRLGITAHRARGARRRDHPSASGGERRGDRRHEPSRLPPPRGSRCLDLDDGGVVLNLGSAVIMPEVFLKALTIARNLNGGRPQQLHHGRSRHAAPLPAAHERRPAPDAAQRQGLRDHRPSRDHGAVARVVDRRAAVPSRLRVRFGTRR